ncbi:MAG: phosphatidate cytidylyltransferase [Gammaproteobacteria bacterium]
MLRQRIVTAVVVILLLLAVILALPRELTIIVLSLLLLGGAWEWAAGFLDLRRWYGRSSYVMVVAAVMLLAWWLAADVTSLEPLLWLALAWWIVATWMVFRFPFPMRNAVVGACGLFVLVPAWLALARLDLVMPRGRELLLFVLALVWAADIGAYFTGRALGRVKLALRVSPNKTWEGVAGGVAAAAAFSLAGAAWFDLPMQVFLPLCVAVAGISVIGDLTVSLFKRRSGLKDSGHLFPGHGGLLDRMDSITAAAPVFVLGVNWLGIEA